MTYPIVEKLHEGVIEYERRWSGDTHAELGGSCNYEANHALMNEAAAIIEALAAALEPLAECDFEEEAQEEWDVYPTTLKIRDLRRAREAMRKLKDETPRVEQEKKP